MSCPSFGRWYVPRHVRKAGGAGLPVSRELGEDGPAGEQRFLLEIKTPRHTGVACARSCSHCPSGNRNQNSGHQTQGERRCPSDHTQTSVLGSGARGDPSRPLGWPLASSSTVLSRPRWVGAQPWEPEPPGTGVSPHMSPSGEGPSAQLTPSSSPGGFCPSEGRPHFWEPPRPCLLPLSPCRTRETWGEALSCGRQALPGECPNCGSGALTQCPPCGHLMPLLPHRRTLLPGGLMSLA